MSYSIDYYNPRVLAEVESWPVDLLAGYARLVELLTEFGADLRMPHSRSLGRGLFELRVGGSGEAGRVMYCFVAGRRIAMLHAFLKKTQRTQQRHLRVARRRMREVRDG
jgi:phage-related protein